MKKFVIRFIISILVIFLLFITSIFYVIIFKSDIIKNKVTENINNQLITKVEIKNFRLEFWKTFPDLSIEMSNLLILDAFENSSSNKKDTLIFSEKTYLHLNLFSLISEDYTINKISVINSKINIRKNNNSDYNYNIIKKSSGNSSQIDIKQISCKNTELNFYDYDNNIIESFNKLILIKLNSNKNYTESNIKSTTNFNKINNFNQDYLNSQTFTINSNIILYKDSIKINKSKVSFSENEIIVNGIKTDNNTSLNLSVKNINIENNRKLFASLFPEIEQKKLEFNGLLSSETYLILNPNNNKIKSEVSFKNLSLEKENDILFSNTEADILINSNNILETSLYSINIINCSSNVNNINLSTNGLLSNLSNPLFELKFKASGNIEDIPKYIKIDSNLIINGKFNLEGKYNGYINENSFSKENYSQNQFEIDLRIEDSYLSYKNESDFQITNSILNINNNDINIEILTGKYEDYDINYNGILKNILPNIIFNTGKIIFDGDLNIDKINIDTSSNQKFEIPEFFNRINSNFNLHINQFNYGSFTALNFSSNTILNNSEIQFKNSFFKACNGNFKGKFIIDLFNTENIPVYGELELSKVNAKLLFKDFDNFSQNEIISENIEGLISGSIIFNSFYRNDIYNFLNNISAQIKIQIENGKLINYKTLESLAKYIDINELKNIEFSTLNTNINIYNKVIDIENTNIESSAMNFSIFGKHTFENNIDYRVNLLLSKILSKKFNSKKSKNSEFEIETNQEGRTKLFLKITGNTDNPIISYDIQNAKAEFKKEIKEEKIEVKKILKKEFGLFKKDSTLNNKITKPNQVIQEVEWDDN